MRKVLHRDSMLPAHPSLPPFPSTPPSFSGILAHCFSSSSPLAPWDRKHPWEVDARGETLLSQCAHHPGGEQEGPEERRAHTERAGQDEAGTATSSVRPKKCALAKFGKTPDGTASKSFGIISHMSDKEPIGRDCKGKALDALQCLTQPEPKPNV